VTSSQATDQGNTQHDQQIPTQQTPPPNNQTPPPTSSQGFSLTQVNELLDTKLAAMTERMIAGIKEAFPQPDQAPPPPADQQGSQNVTAGSTDSDNSSVTKKTAPKKEATADDKGKDKEPAAPGKWSWDEGRGWFR
jgi:hypothetical protein